MRLWSCAQNETFEIKRPQQETTWGITANMDGWQLYTESFDEAITHVGPLFEELPCTIVREGLQGIDKGNNLDVIDFDRFVTPLIDWLYEHNMKLCLAIFPGNVTNPGNAYGDE